MVAAIEFAEPKIPVIRIPLYKIMDVVQQIIDLYRKCRKVVVGFSFMTPQILLIKELVKLIKLYTPQTLLVAGGPHATGDYLGTITRLGFDIVVYGEGEETIVELLRKYSESDEYRVCGTAYSDGDRIIVRKRTKFVNLDFYPPFPYWKGVVNPIEIMRGCSLACYFCQVTYSFGLPRYRSVEVIVKYAKKSIENGLADLRFIAPNSLGYGSKDGVKPNHDALYNLLSSLHNIAKEYGGRVFFGTFPSEIRPDSVDVESADILKRFVNNRRVIVGAQSGSNKILRIIHRGHTVEDVENAIDILIQKGFGVDIDLIFGFPFEDEEDFKATIDFMEKYMDKNVRFHLHTFIPLPGTPFSDLESKPLDSRKKAVLSKFIGKGKAYGYWIQQEKISSLISWLKQSKVIYGPRENAQKSKLYYC